VTQTCHLISFPHTQTDGTYATCAYTSKVEKLCRMLHGHGRHIILYGGEHNAAPVDEHVVCVSAAKREEWFGPHDEDDLGRGGFDWDPSSPWWQHMNTVAAGEVMKRAEPHDLLLLSMGQSQQPVADANPMLTVAEHGVGYEGLLNVGSAPKRIGGPCYAAFESYAHMHAVYRRWDLHNQMNERWFDEVIPNYFDPEDFPEPDRAALRRAEWRGGYLLFVGRLIANKGAHIAARIAAELDMPLVVAGPGALSHGPGWVQAKEIRVEAPKLEFVGTVGVKERAELMAGAAVTLMPSTYVEPFGGVAVESMMAGTPAVTTPWGAFVETVQEGVSGYRFHTLAEGIAAVEKAMLLDRGKVREYAMSRYSLDAVRPQFERWFDRLDLLWQDGWETLAPRDRLLLELAPPVEALAVDSG
jgi:glycosyltransferase involved in cell wall biosynthesis